MPSPFTPQVDAIANGDANWGPKVKADIDALVVQIGLAAVNTYRVASGSALSALTGMRPADMAVRTDTGTTYRYTGSTWQPWDSNWGDYVPNSTGVTGTKGGTPGYNTAARWRYAAGIVVCEGVLSLTASASSTLTANPNIDLPVAASTYAGTYPRGRCAAFDSSAGSTYYAHPEWVGASKSVFQPVAGGGAYADVLSYFTWAQGDLLTWSIEYEPAF